MLAAACASMPAAPHASLNAAKMAISNAERADASHYAGAELGEARQKLALADKAVVQEDMIERLAEESRVEAELAFARTQAAKATAVNKESEHQPVADNDSESGRQQNRRVEVIIENPPAIAPLTSR